MVGGSNTEYDYLFKILMIGDSGVGKSSVLERFVDDTYNESFISTIGIDFRIRTIYQDDKIIKLQIWDTAGQERYHSITSSYYRGAQGVILVYDVTDRSTFDKLSTWLTNSNTYAKDKCFTLLIGNKIDLVNKRQVSYETAKQFADENGLDYIETSAKSGNNVENAFLTCASRIKDKVIEYRKQLDEQKININKPESTIIVDNKCC